MDERRHGTMAQVEVEVEHHFNGRKVAHTCGLILLQHILYYTRKLCAQRKFSYLVEIKWGNKFVEKKKFTIEVYSIISDK